MRGRLGCEGAVAAAGLRGFSQAAPERPAEKACRINGMRPGSDPERTEAAVLSRAVAGFVAVLGEWRLASTGQLV